MLTSKSVESHGLAGLGSDEIESQVHDILNLKGRQGVSTAMGAAALLLGAVGLGVLSVWVPLLDRHEDGFALVALGDPRPVAMVPAWAMIAVLLAIASGVVGLLVTLLHDGRLRRAVGWCWRWLAGHRLWASLLLVTVGAGAVDFYELMYDPYNKKTGTRVWMLREDLQIWMAFGAAVMGALAISALWSGSYALASVSGWWQASLRRHPVRWWVAAGAIPCVMGAVMASTALEGIPHFSDSLTYLMQGRILHSGRLALDSPACPELFQHSLFFIETEGRFYGKYPIGWPAVLGTFDRLGVGYAANAVLAGLAAVLTGLVAGRFASTRVAVLAAVLLGLSPWAWFNGANFASHVASTCAVMGFMWLFLRTVDTGGLGSALGAGLLLGLAVLVRPFDAAMFALPAVFVVLVMQVRQPKRWLPAGTLIALGALVGVGVYMWVNAHTTGSPLKSPYSMESRWDSDWSPTVGSMLARLAFQWVELNGRFPGWGVGGLTVAVLGAAAAGARWRTVGLPLLTVGTVLFFLGCCTFGFTNVWWGPRWLFPVAPLLAILGAMLVDRVLTAAAMRPGRHAPLGGEGGAEPAVDRPPQAGAAAQLALSLLLAGLMVGVTTRWAGQYYHHTIMPPHAVSARAHQVVTKYLDEAGVDRAVVAMPVTGQRAPLDARAGLAFMVVPFEDNRVIYVRSVEGWVSKADQTFPDRLLYEVQPDDSRRRGFTVQRVHLNRSG